jgi:hypothetical protein
MIRVSSPCLSGHKRDRPRAKPHEVGRARRIRRPARWSARARRLRSRRRLISVNTWSSSRATALWPSASAGAPLTKIRMTAAMCSAISSRWCWLSRSNAFSEGGSRAKTLPSFPARPRHQAARRAPERAASGRTLSIEIATMPPIADPSRRASRRIAGSSRPVACAPKRPIRA